MTKTVAAATLGCKVNFYETEAMLAPFRANGWNVADFSETADVYIINTCAVTSLGSKKSRQMIRRAVSMNPAAVVAAVGCMVQAEPDTAAAIEGVDIVLGTKDRSGLYELVAGYERGRERETAVSEPSREYEEMGGVVRHERQRVYIKVQDGCDRYCSYCIIPYLRGPSRSRDFDKVLDEARQVSAKEIVLSGIHLSSYGRGTDRTLVDLIESLSEIDGIERIRLGSLEPGIVTEDFAARLSKLSKLCDHFHLSLQSGCEKTLSNMNRRYTPERYLDALRLLRAGFPNCALTTDVIAGFPGETDGDHRESYDFCRDSGLSRLHVFPFSARKGTKAHDMQPQVDKQTKLDRAAELITLSDKLWQGFLKSQSGKPNKVLFEQEQSPGVYSGHTTNYIELSRPYDRDVRGEILNVVV